MSKERILVLHGGERVRITGEEGKYWLCGDRRFRKLSHSVHSVEEAEIQDATAEAVEEEPVPVKKTSKKKKKTEEEEPKEGE